ncbi:MAG: class I SAM-dependent methyltransferase [Actinomycetota bacterium]|nr:class I SAM-dependent methyltransferase [Actinomycetota bacterium]
MGRGWKQETIDAEGGSAVVQYGPDIGTEAEFRLLGNVSGKRVLDLGCGSGQAAVAFAKQGAHAIALDSSTDHLGAAKRRCERENVRVELHQGDLADLAFMRADSVDLVFSAWAFNEVSDLSRVFRQVHRVLKTGAPLVFSVPHPAYDIIDDSDPEQPLLIRRSYFDRSPVDESGETPFGDYHHTLSDLFMGLTRNNFRVDVLLEPESKIEGPVSRHWREAFLWVPRTLIMRARKEGI